MKLLIRIVHDVDGSVAITEESWITEGNLSSLLLSLQVLLSNPELEFTCIRNHSAAELLSRAPQTYKQTVLDCVLASIKSDRKCECLYKIHCRVRIYVFCIILTIFTLNFFSSY